MDCQLISSADVATPPALAALPGANRTPLFCRYSVASIVVQYKEGSMKKIFFAMFVLAVLTVAGWKGDDRRVEAAMPRESQASVDTGQVRKTTLREIANYPVLREQARKWFSLSASL